MLGKRAGANLGYTSTPTPHGPGVEYLQAAAAVIGARMSAGHAVRLIRLHRKRQPVDSAMGGAGGLQADATVIPASQE
jgi:hypothetical protein